MSEFAREIERTLGSVFDAAAGRDGDHVGGWDEVTWATLNQNGFVALDYDDEDFGLAEVVAIARASGRAATALPVADAAGVAAWLVARSKLELPDGVLVAAVAHPADVLRATRSSEGGLRVSGALNRVPHGRRADHVVALAETDEGPRVVLLPHAGGVVEGQNLAREPRDLLTYDDVEVPSSSHAPADGLEHREWRARAALVRSAAASGAMQRVLDIVLDYGSTREQFGQPIASFQAVQHHIVTVAEASAATTAAVDAAVIAAPSHRLLAVASAKVTAAHQSALLARSAHQVLGAIGATEEHELHTLTTRLWSWQDEAGDADDWGTFLGQQLVFEDSPGLWNLLTPPSSALDTRELSEVWAW